MARPVQVLKIARVASAAMIRFLTTRNALTRYGHNDRSTSPFRHEKMTNLYNTLCFFFCHVPYSSTMASIVPIILNARVATVILCVICVFREMNNECKSGSQ